MSSSSSARRAMRERVVGSAGFDEVLAQLFERYLGAVSDPFAVSHTVQVTSFGGTGTTALCAHLEGAGLDLPKGPDWWPFKHAPEPPADDAVPDGFRALYVHSDPREAVLSLFRRGLQVGHCRRVRRIREPPEEVLRELASLESFVAAGRDEFELAAHASAWLDRPRRYPVLALRFESLPGTWPSVRRFLGLPDDHPCVDVLDRQTMLVEQPEAVRVGLDAMYGELAERLDSLPAVCRVDPAGRPDPS